MDTYNRYPGYGISYYAYACFIHRRTNIEMNRMKSRKVMSNYGTISDSSSWKQYGK